MSTNERLRGVQVYRPIIYGSHARLLTDQEKETAPPTHTHRWTVFLTSAASPPPPPSSSTDAPPIDMDYIPGGADDLSYLIKKVTFRLHETYTNPNRVIDKPPFRVTETGWGEFTVNIRVQFIPESGEKPLALAHTIKLHHWGKLIEAPEPEPASADRAPASAVPTQAGNSTPAATSEAGPSGSSAQTPAPAAAAVGTSAQGSNTAEAAVKTEAAAVTTPAPASDNVADAASGTKALTDVEKDPPDDASGTIVVGSSTAPDPAAAPLDSASTPLESTVIATQPTGTAVPISVAAMYPVHSWQYDELVFSDPTSTFLEIMNRSPPTRLPPRNRRARDQREEHEARSGKGTGSGSAKRHQKGRISAVASGSGSGAGARSREGTATPAADNDPAKEGGLAAFHVGIPGEPGSADVPLEFSQEMEKGEYNRLAEARVRIIEEMDKWRERLIAQEKELARMKEDMKSQAQAQAAL